MPYLRIPCNKNAFSCLIKYVWISIHIFTHYTRIFIHSQAIFYNLQYKKISKGVLRLISYAPLFKTMKDKQITSYRLEKLGFSRATYYSIQKGNSVSTNTINQLCKLLKCSVSDVMEFVDEDEKT